MTSDNRAIPGHEFAKALEAAGIVSDLDTIERIVIDVRWDRVDIHVKRIGTKRLLGLAPLLEPLVAEGVQRVTRYWVLVSQPLLDDPATPWADAGLRLAEQGPWEHPGVRWCLFEDEEAPEELDGKKVDLTFERDADGKTRITERRVVT